MAITADAKQETIGKFKRHDNDTGSSEVQVALLSKRIDNLSTHFEAHKKDHASRRGLIMMVNQRRRLLDYLKSTDGERYSRVIADLGLRK